MGGGKRRKKERKETTHESADNESETGERRTEGMDAPVFSHPITSNGFTPHYPAPPKYIKVRTHHKKTPDFNRVFLAQELGRHGTSNSNGEFTIHAPPTLTDASASTTATWSLEFSVDGRYLAAGGQDRMVRVWAVISTSEERQAHENEEATTTSIDSTGPAMRLDAPVFKKDPIRVYVGHTSDVLDLSWSKVGLVPWEEGSSSWRRRRRRPKADLGLEQLSPLVIHGQDGTAMAREQERMSLLLQTQRLRHLHCLSPPR